MVSSAQFSFPAPFFLRPLHRRAGRYIVGRYDQSERQQLLKLLVDPTEGLGLTRLRYQIPPPFTPPGSPGVWASYDHDWTSYLPSKGKYNLWADWKQMLAVLVRTFTAPKKCWWCRFIRFRRGVPAVV